MRIPLGVMAALLAGVLVLGSRPAVAAPDLAVMVCAPGGPGSTEEAVPRLEKFFDLVEKLAGWPADRVAARYLNTTDGCAAYLKEKKPQVAILSLGMFLADGTKLAAEPLLEVIPVGGGEQRYHVVVEKDPATDLKGLAGKTLAGDALDDVRFLSRVVFAGAVDAKMHFTLKTTRTALRGIKLVHGGKSDAVLLDSRSLAELKKLPFGGDMRTVFTSEPIPGWPLVALGDAKAGDRLAKADRAALLGAFQKVCVEPDAKALCDEMRIGTLREVKAATYEKVRALYDGDAK